jgi:hypothetical protein
MGNEITLVQIEQADFKPIEFEGFRNRAGLNTLTLDISDWLRNRNTVEFLGIWERVQNPNSNYGEFPTIRSQAGLNNYKISVKEWAEKTCEIGLSAKAATE